ncbi:hypothetical protein QNI19_14495 [Cytophagaceae bacterium DM2B3-1]|uniref:Oxidase n=1 Tax=Xanthocytophaga flava TaxID=3048013 RepID=A0ABT7CMC7_9BACT|nr:hypothetical protein [Xanthocytophaga flavus]MDJ1494150.1 hypothetical protein [Xanthocytophaga flavus]
MKDILLDDNNDLLIQNGDIVIGNCDLQNIQLICLSNTGDWKENPTFGVNIKKSLLDHEPYTAIKHALQIQLEADGATVEKIVIDSDLNLSVDAYYGTDNS